jgi:hypothetical protein
MWIRREGTVKPGDLVQVQGNFSRVWGIILSREGKKYSTMWKVFRSDGTIMIYYYSQITTPEEL